MTTTAAAGAIIETGTDGGHASDSATGTDRPTATDGTAAAIAMVIGVREGETTPVIELVEAAKVLLTPMPAALATTVAIRRRLSVTAARIPTARFVAQPLLSRG